VLADAYVQAGDAMNAARHYEYAQELDQYDVESLQRIRNFTQKGDEPKE
jgi:hypothetical protein